MKNILEHKYFKIGAIIFILALILFIVISSTISKKHKIKCQSLKDEILIITDQYIEDNGLLPTLNGAQVIVNLEDMDTEFYFGKKMVTGTITYTKYNDDIIKTFEIKNAGYCSTKKFKKESKKYVESKNTKVNVYFNYQTVESYNSKYTNYLPSEKIATVETDGVLLPINSKDLPVIPNGAVITEYVREVKTYYSYRDKKWKWYKNNIEYSDYSSTQPAGYTYKDDATKATTEPTEWSLNYPEVYDYRHISSKKAYKWYKTEGKQKIYWENGAYAIEAPSDEYKKDKDSETTMYSYYDEVWRWYNGNTKRIYSSLSSTMPNGYNYKDETTLSYTNWSKFTDESKLDSSNESYREEKEDLYSRYLLKYDVYSNSIFNEPVTLEELEEKVGKSYEDIMSDDKIKVEIIFRFRKEA